MAGRPERARRTAMRLMATAAVAVGVTLATVVAAGAEPGLTAAFSEGTGPRVVAAEPAPAAPASQLDR